MYAPACVPVYVDAVTLTHAVCCCALYSRYLPSSFVTMGSQLAPWHLSSSYGLFRRMTGTLDEGAGMTDIIQRGVQSRLFHPGAGVAVGRRELEVLGSSDGLVRRGRGRGRGAFASMQRACMHAWLQPHPTHACWPKWLLM